MAGPSSTGRVAMPRAAASAISPRALTGLAANAVSGPISAPGSGSWCRTTSSAPAPARRRRRGPSRSMCPARTGRAGRSMPGPRRRRRRCPGRGRSTRTCWTGSRPTPASRSVCQTSARNPAAVCPSAAASIFPAAQYASTACLQFPVPADAWVAEHGALPECRSHQTFRSLEVPDGAREGGRQGYGPKGRPYRFRPDPPERSSAAHTGGVRSAGRSSDSWARPKGHLPAVASQAVWPSALLTAFVPTHRCGQSRFCTGFPLKDLSVFE